MERPCGRTASSVTRFSSPFNYPTCDGCFAPRTAHAAQLNSMSSSADGTRLAPSVTSNEEDPMQIKDIMSTPAVTCPADATLDQAARAMWDSDCGILPVVFDDGRLAGVVTDRDIC